MGGTDFERLFEKALSEDTEKREEVLLELGQHLSHRHAERFVKLLEFFVAEGEFDVTYLNSLAVEVMIDVCSGQNRSLRFQKKDKTIIVVRFPESELRELFVSYYIEEPW